MKKTKEPYKYTKKAATDKQKRINFSALRMARADNYNKDRTIKTADEYADHIMKELTESAIYSTEITQY